MSIAPEQWRTTSSHALRPASALELSDGFEVMFRAPDYLSYDLPQATWGRKIRVRLTLRGNSTAVMVGILTGGEWTRARFELAKWQPQLCELPADIAADGGVVNLLARGAVFIEQAEIGIFISNRKIPPTRPGAV